MFSKVNKDDQCDAISPRSERKMPLLCVAKRLGDQYIKR